MDKLNKSGLVKIATIKMQLIFPSLSFKKQSRVRTNFSYDSHSLSKMRLVMDIYCNPNYLQQITLSFMIFWDGTISLKPVVTVANEEFAEIIF